VGDHIIASFRDQSLLYDFHLHEEALHSISLHPEFGRNLCMSRNLVIK